MDTVLCYAQGFNDAIDYKECDDAQFDGLTAEHDMRSAYLDGYYAGIETTLDLNP